MGRGIVSNSWGLTLGRPDPPGTLQRDAPAKANGRTWGMEGWCPSTPDPQVKSGVPRLPVRAECNCLGQPVADQFPFGANTLEHELFLHRVCIGKICAHTN